MTKVQKRRKSAGAIQIRLASFVRVMRKPSLQKLIHARSRIAMSSSKCHDGDPMVDRKRIQPSRIT
jgi:hypothetical protein